MIGTLIGDFAAGAYENNTDIFWKQLIPDKGQGISSSIYGETLLKAADYYLNNLSSEPLITGNITDGCCYIGRWLMWGIAAAWSDHYLPSTQNYYILKDKDLHYAIQFVAELVRLLRNGATKNEAYHSVKTFEHLSKSTEWRFPNKNSSLVSYVLRAWNSFYLGFDYTSTIHNAVKWSGDIHLTCAIAGTFADAMYGCNFNLLKQKYSQGNYLHPFDLSSVGEKLGYDEKLIEKMCCISYENRSFFAKNNSMTNVEKHEWKNIELPFTMEFSTEEKARILQAGETGWENRFGIYLDDGKIYCYRSGFLLLRFMLKEDPSSHKFKVTKIQTTGERNDRISLLGWINALIHTCRVSVSSDIRNYLSDMK